MLPKPSLEVDTPGIGCGCSDWAKRLTPVCLSGSCQAWPWWTLRGFRTQKTREPQGGPGLTFYHDHIGVLSPKAPPEAVLSEFLSVSGLRDTSPWRSRRPTQAPGGGARSPPHCGAHSGQAVRGNRVNSHENSDKWAPPPLPPPSIKAKLSQARCRNHFQARHDINISVIRGGQWGVRD